MGFSDLFKPKWKHSNPDVRAEAVRTLSDDDAALLATIARSDADARVRRLAVKRIVDADVLSDVAAHDPDESLRKVAIEKAEELLVGAAGAGDRPALEALARMNHPRLLVAVALESPDADVRALAVQHILDVADDKALAEIMRKSSDVALRRTIVAWISDAAALRDIAIGDGNKEIALAAVARLDDRAALDRVAHKAQSKAVRQAAREKLPPPEKKPESPEAARRARLLALVRAVEQAADPGDVEAARAQFAHEAAQDQSGELRRRFDRACERFYAKRAATANKPSAIRRAPPPAVAPIATPAPPLPVIEATPIVDEDAEKMRAEREQERKRRDAAEAEARARRDAEKAEARARREAEEQANLTRLAELAAALEAVTVDDAKRGVDALKRAQQAYDALGPLGRDATPQKARWQAARDKLRARVNELYEAEEWKRWANVPKLEALCARAEALLEETDLKKAAAGLRQLHVEWKSAGPTTKDKQEQLWQRFKAAADQVHERTRAHFAVLDEQRGANLAKKEELAARVEALADSSDWKESAELIKALQEEWKAVGPVPKDKADELWKRFRGACDKFFDRRKAHFEAGDAERAANLARQEALVAAAEALAASSDWKRTGDELKRLQAEWKTIGPVPRDKADDAWKRFRAACDKFFDARKLHFDKLDEERAANLAAKRLLCEKAEALADAPADEALDTVKALQSEWRTVGPAPKESADEVWSRFRAACDKIYDRARTPPPAVAPTTSAPQGYSAPKLGDLLKK